MAGQMLPYYILVYLAQLPPTTIFHVKPSKYSSLANNNSLWIMCGFRILEAISPDIKLVVNWEPSDFCESYPSSTLE